MSKCEEEKIEPINLKLKIEGALPTLCAHTPWKLFEGTKATPSGKHMYLLKTSEIPDKYCWSLRSRDFCDTLEIDQYMALSKEDLMIHWITNTHSLISQHVETLASIPYLSLILVSVLQSQNDKQHLRVLNDELGPAPITSSTKGESCHRAESDIQSDLMDWVSTSDMLYMETNSILVQLIRSIPHAAEKRPYNLAAIAERVATTKDATLEMLRELEKQNITEAADGYKLLQDEVAAELARLGNLREKVVLETKSLEAVVLEQYKAHLQNVRLIASKDKGSATGAGVVTVTRLEAKRGSH
ncbi:hypothetical protein DFJ58DRAFT_915842 [Suillus subalutaceus]|uniref:uncharacterized protein n=1 Tax=Suillus subalutaceus TaxID=48586 RepID=UPI001B87CA57|nr:uncharacterized protein DFJ58DRAFT_915842 [Suillus subalutaceus]KAG1844054.1 hypothetical protein DFJ58DRAFT_915842 [Suillus subalutaceus]